MVEYDITRKSRPVVISPYDERWAEEFVEIAGRIRESVGAAAVRVDHVGSTAVKGLAAKDVIDVQVSVADLERAQGVTGPLRGAGFRRGEEFVYDEFRAMAADDARLRKLYMREPEGCRRVHIHVREVGRFNQR